jgi:hypothetical protein
MKYNGDLPHTTVGASEQSTIHTVFSQSSAPPPNISRSGNVHNLEELDLLRLLDKNMKVASFRDILESRKIQSSTSRC